MGVIVIQVRGIQKEGVKKEVNSRIQRIIKIITISIRVQTKLNYKYN